MHGYKAISYIQTILHQNGLSIHINILESSARIQLGRIVFHTEDFMLPAQISENPSPCPRIQMRNIRRAFCSKQNPYTGYLYRRLRSKF